MRPYTRNTKNHQPKIRKKPETKVHKFKSKKIAKHKRQKIGFGEMVVRFNIITTYFSKVSKPINLNKFNF